MRVEHLAEGVTLYCGDCLEVLPALNLSNPVVVSDVPYGVAFKSGWGNKFRGISIANDESTKARDVVVDWVGSNPAILFGSWKIAKPKGTKATLIWDKGTVGMGDLSLPWFPATEEIYVLGKGYVGTRTTPVLRHYVRNEFHPTEKPVSLMSELIQKCDPDWHVVDPFMGSGTTGVAAVKLGRKFTGIEVDPGHFETALRRVSGALREPDMFAPPKPAEQLSILDGAA